MPISLKGGPAPRPPAVLCAASRAHLDGRARRTCCGPRLLPAQQAARAPASALGGAPRGGGRCGPGRAGSAYGVYGARRPAPRGCARGQLRHWRFRVLTASFSSPLPSTSSPPPASVVPGEESPVPRRMARPAAGEGAAAGEDPGESGALRAGHSTDRAHSVQAPGNSPRVLLRPAHPGPHPPASFLIFNTRACKSTGKGRSFPEPCWRASLDASLEPWVELLLCGNQLFFFLKCQFY